MEEIEPFNRDEYDRRYYWKLYDDITELCSEALENLGNNALSEIVSVLDRVKIDHTKMDIAYTLKNMS